MAGLNRWRIELNPIVVRELRTRMRGGRPYLVLTIFLVLLSLAGVGIYQLMAQQMRFGGILLSAQVGQGLFRGLAFCEVLLIVVLAPAMTSGAISSERERLTYDMLMATPLRPWQLLVGKLVAALSYLLLLIFAAVPVFSVVLVFGGVDVPSLLKTLLLLLATTVSFGAIGLFCSALLRSTARATTVSYVIVLLLVGVPAVLGSVWGLIATPQGQAVPPPVVYLNPFSALLSVTTVVPPSVDPGAPFFGFGDPLGAIPLLTMLSPGVIHYGPMGQMVVPIYRATLIAYLGLTTLLIWASAHLVLPNRRWRPRWADLLFVLLLGGLGLFAYLSREWWYVLPPPVAAFG